MADSKVEPAIIDSLDTRTPALATADGDGHTAGMRRALLAWAAGLVLVGCELSLGLGVGPGDDPPSVSLAAAPQSAAAGERIGLVAAASDDYAVVEVQFFRVDVGGDTFLGADRSEPFALETTLPAGVVGSVRYFARAVDDAGQATSSAIVEVTVR
jgi:hypothetical protein